MEAFSVEDEGRGVSFNVFCYNVQPGVDIVYASGESCLSGQQPLEKAGDGSTQPVGQVKEPVREEIPVSPANEPRGGDVSEAVSSGVRFVVNAKNGKIHISGQCPATGVADSAMKESVPFGNYEEAEAYSNSITPNNNKRLCGNCWQVQKINCQTDRRRR